MPSPFAISGDSPVAIDPRVGEFPPVEEAPHHPIFTINPAPFEPLVIPGAEPVTPPELLTEPIARSRFNVSSSECGVGEWTIVSSNSLNFLRLLCDHGLQLSMLHKATCAFKTPKIVTSRRKLT